MVFRARTARVPKIPQLARKVFRNVNGIPAKAYELQTAMSAEAQRFFQTWG